MKARFVFEVGPITLHNYGSVAAERKALRDMERAMDGLLRAYWQVGRRDKTVVSRIEESGAA